MVSRFNLLKSFNYTPYLFSKKVDNTALYRDNFFIVCGLSSHPRTSERDLLTPPVASVNCLYSDFTAYTYNTVNTREKAGEPYSSAPACRSYLSDDHVRSASSKLPVAGISRVLQLSGLCPCSLLFDVSVTKKSWPTATLILLK